MIRQSMQELLQAIEGILPESPKSSEGDSAPAISVMQLELRQAPGGALELSPSMPEVQVRVISACALVSSLHLSHPLGATLACRHVCGTDFEQQQSKQAAFSHAASAWSCMLRLYSRQSRAPCIVCFWNARFIITEGC